MKIKISSKYINMVSVKLLKDTKPEHHPHTPIHPPPQPHPPTPTTPHAHPHPHNPTTPHAHPHPPIPTPPHPPTPVHQK